MVRFAESFSFGRIFGNTLGLSVYHLLAGFPIPILLALALNYVRSAAFKKTVQLVTYAPHFHLHGGDRGHDPAVPGHPAAASSTP